MKSSKEVDWNKAPDGATHYNGALGYPWLRGVPVSYFNGNDWIEYKSDDSLWEDHFFNAVKRPQEMENEEWDGGVPPVGTVCEYLWTEGNEWRKCEVVAYYFANVVAVDVLDSAAVLVQPMMVRPIKTPEQIAAEERLLAIDEMVVLAQHSGSIFKDVMSALYDAGYRKTEVKKWNLAS